MYLFIHCGVESGDEEKQLLRYYNWVETANNCVATANNCVATANNCVATANNCVAIANNCKNNYQ